MTNSTLPYMRPCTPEDYWRIRAFLREVYLLNSRHEHSWQAARLDYCRWHIHESIAGCRLQDVTFVWETVDGRIVAVVNAEEAGHAYFHVHPAHRDRAMEEQMLSLALERLTPTDSHGTRPLTVWAQSTDELRREVLLRRGFVKGDWPEYQRYRALDIPIPDAPVPAGYSVRALGDGLEVIERCWASGRGFHADDIIYAVRNREDVTWYRNIQNAPQYRRDLDLIAVAPDGAIAAFATVWFDDVTRTGLFEPVATVPEHRRLGLGKAVMCEGLRRLRRLGATLATVGSYSPEAHALYAGVGFADYDLCERWVKE